MSRAQRKNVSSSSGSAGVAIFTNAVLIVICSFMVVLIAFTIQLGMERTGDPFEVMTKLPFKFSAGAMETIESFLGGKDLDNGGASVVEEEVIECDAGDQECLFKQKATRIKADDAPKGANKEGTPREVSLSQCADRHDQCKGFASVGECERNPGWMVINCPRSCDSCDLLDHRVRCDRNRLNITNDHVYAPGDMQSMFSNIKDKFDDRYGVNILSDDPWVVTFDNFLTDTEISELIKSVNDNWERSTDTGQQNEFGETGRILSESRTSNNAWCRQECDQNVHVQEIVRKIEEVTRVPAVNFEAFQVLRYQYGQKYNRHHDASTQQAQQASGIRILTFFLYLSDVEEGGETSFPQLKIDVKPKKGGALLWPSVLDSDPNKIDHRTSHAALPVKGGIKFAANTWIHSHDFSTSNLWGCTGTFDELTP